MSWTIVYEDEFKSCLAFQYSEFARRAGQPKRALERLDRFVSAITRLDQGVDDLANLPSISKYRVLRRGVWSAYYRIDPNIGFAMGMRITYGWFRLGKILRKLDARESIFLEACQKYTSPGNSC